MKNQFLYVESGEWKKQWGERRKKGRKGEVWRKGE